MLPGGTIPDVRLRPLLEDLCGKCGTAARAAVEAFLESSDRRHAGVPGADWFAGTLGFGPWGLSEVVLQSMRQAVFVDNTGLPIESRPPLSADGDAAAATAAQTSAGKDVSDDVLTLLFLLSRSLLGGVDALEGVRRRVVTALDRPHWWLRY